MLRSLNSCLFVAFLLALAPLAEAQRPGGGGGPGRGGFGAGGFGAGGRGGQLDATTLVGIEQVQKEIGLTGEKLEAVKEVINSSREAGREMFAGLGNIREMSEEDRTKAIAEMRTKREKMTAELTAKINPHLSAEQITRLNQIVLQQQGVRALDQADVIVKLDLTEDQQLKIAELNESLAAEQRTIMEGAREAGRDGFAQIREKSEALRKGTEAKVLAVLTAAQAEKFVAMKGKPFELDRSAMFGGGRGPGGAGRQPSGDNGNGGNRTDGNRRQRPAAE